MNFNHFFLILISIAFISVIHNTDAIVLPTCKSTLNVQPCQCQGASGSVDCYCHSSTYSGTTTCTDATPVITCQSQCGNGALYENTGNPNVFTISQKSLSGPSTCPDCQSDGSGGYKTCREFCDTGPGTMGLYVGPTATTCCPRNCGWDGVSTTGVALRTTTGVFDRFNIVPRPCFDASDCGSAPGWTVSCYYNGLNGYCRYIPNALTILPISGSFPCPTLPCYSTSIQSGSCRLSTYNNYINSVYNVGTGYGASSSEAFNYCYKNSTDCWVNPSCSSGTIIATEVARTLSGHEATATVQGVSSNPLSTFVGTSLTLSPPGPTVIPNAFSIISTTCPGTVVISGTNIVFNSSVAAVCKIVMTVRTTCYQHVIFTKNVNIVVCGDSIVDSSEACDSGALNGYYYNGNCCAGCSTTGTTGANYLISAKKCTNPSECDDGNFATSENCVNGWCVHMPITVTLPTANCTPTSCMDYPCYPATCVPGTSTTSAQCLYNTYSNNIQALTNSHCKVESACTHSLKCTNNNWGNYVSYTSSSISLSALVVAPQRCNSGVALNVSQLVQSSWTDINDLFGVPNTTYSLYVNASLCPLTAQITSGSQPTILFSGTWTNIGGVNPNLCQVEITAQTSCGQTAKTNVLVPVTCCGDNIIQSSYEICDAGTGNGQYGTCCSSSCALTPGVKCRDSSGSCDQGAFCTALSDVCPSNTPAPSTTSCFNATGECTVDRTCDGFTFTCPSGLRPIGSNCNIDGNLCTIDACDSTGNCIVGPLLSYDNGQHCDGIETCDSSTGLMVVGIPPDCSDGSSCTLDSCDENIDSCVHTPVSNSTGVCGVSNVGECEMGTFSCDGSGPTPVITCVGAVYPTPEKCVPGTRDENCDGVVDEGCTTVGCFTDADCSNFPTTQCKIAFCNASSVCDLQLKPVGSSCDDGLGCTSADVCDDVGHCMGTPVVCSNGGNTCVQPYCSEPLGTCLIDLSFYTGAPCDCGSLACTTNCTCTNQGQCGNGSPVVCPSTGNQCTESICDPLDDQCKINNILGSCNDGLDCTSFDSCTGGQCQGIPINVDDGIVCTLDSCLEPGGVISHTLATGYCFIDNTCYLDGTVNPSDPCTVCRVSSSTSAWSFTLQLNVPCNDGIRCTSNDQCNIESLSCVGTPIDCSSFNNDCNTAVCVESTGTCVLTPVVDDTPCPSLDFCLVDKKCRSGVCSLGEPRNCSSSSSQCSIGSCNSSLQQCISTPLPDNTQCSDDNNVCNGPSICLGGDCLNGDPPVPPPDGECYHYICDPLLGFIRVIDEGLPCNSTSDCNTNNHCDVNGVCDQGTPVDCNDLNPCTDDFCATEGGCYHVPLTNCEACTTASDCSAQTCHEASCNALNQCEYSLLPVDTPCPDGNHCNGAELCTATGTCVSQSPLNCTSLNPCMDGYCDPLLGCYEIPNPQATPISDDPCFVNGHCDDFGNVIFDQYPCPSSDACHTYACQNVDNLPVCVATILVNNTCNDGTDCTLDDKCDAIGNCVGAPIECRDPTQCEASVDCVGGECVPINKPYGSSCNNGNLCFENICDGLGGCGLGDPIVVCQPVNECYGSGTCIPNLGVCTTPVLPDNTPCSSTNGCDILNACIQGSCTPIVTQDCSDNGQCELHGFCNRTTERCEYPPVSDYTPCDNNNACVSLSVCIDRQCVDTDFVVCPNSTCMDYVCDSQLGCVSSFNQDPCEGQNLCYTNYHCVDGVCPPTSDTLVDCNDLDPCTLDQCYPQIGCVNTPISNCHACSINATLYTGAPECPVIPCNKAYCGGDNQCYYVPDDTYIQGCVDTNFCNGQERCSLGQCLHGVPPSCNDLNGCTIDLCNTTLDQCTNTPNVGLQCGLTDQCVFSSQCGIDGGCHPVDVIQCPTSTNQCKMLTGCDPLTGCVYTNIPDGVSCVSSNPCAIQSVCQQGTCNDITFKQCHALDQCHVPGQCDTLTGNCTHPPKPDFSPCDDGIGCTAGDSCQSAQCQPGQFSFCDNIVHDLQCQAVICIENSTDPQCTIINLDGEPCDDGQPDGVCTKRKVCNGGVCSREYNVGDTCRPAADECDVAEVCGHSDDCPVDSYHMDGHPCDSILYCFDNACMSGVCTPSIPIQLPPDPSPCISYVCDETQRAFIQVNKPDGSLCNGGPLGQCGDYYQCSTGNCLLVPSSATKSCDDGNNCTIGDHCSGTSDVCIAGSQKDCSFLNSQCVTGACDAPSGVCITQVANEGGPCNADNNPCTPLDTCQNKVCVPGTIKDCTHLNTNCSVGSCVAVNATYGSCFSTPTSDACNPDSCTGGCVLSHGYWSTHNAYARPKGLNISWPFNLENTMLCGDTWYSWSQKTSGNNAWIKLFDQWLAATLNLKIGACMPASVREVYNISTALLAQCNTTITVSSLASANYKKYAAILEAYDSGTMSPSSCTSSYQNSGSNHMMSRLVIAQENPESNEEDVDVTYPLSTLFQNSVSAENCINGVYNFLTAICECYYGWGGPQCSDCGIPDEDTNTFLCVPASSGDPFYILQSISNDKVDQYLSKSLPILQLSSLTPVYPNTEGLDCSCALIEGNGLTHSRSVVVNIFSTQDTESIIAFLQEEFEECQALFDTEITVSNNCSNTTVVIEIETNDDDDDDRWRFADHLFWIVPLIVIGSILILCILIYFLSSRQESSILVESDIHDKESSRFHHKYEHSYPSHHKHH